MEHIKIHHKFVFTRKAVTPTAVSRVTWGTEGIFFLFFPLCSVTRKTVEIAKILKYKNNTFSRRNMQGNYSIRVFEVLDRSC